MATDRYGNAEPHITSDGWGGGDGIPILLCPRQSCASAHGYWVTEIDHLTPEQVIAVRDKHVEEMH